MKSNITTFGKQTQLDSPELEFLGIKVCMPLFDSRAVLWRNVSALMVKKYGKVHISQLSKEAKVGLATIGRIKSQDTSIGSDVIDRIATVLGAEPWQLLHPKFDPENPNDFASYSPLAADIARQLNEIAPQSVQEKAYALASQVIGLAASSIEPAPALAPAPKKLPEPRQ